MSNRRALENRVTVYGRTMNYVEMGSDDLQHGNPMSLCLWRNIMPHLREHSRYPGGTENAPGLSAATQRSSQNKAITRRCNYPWSPRPFAVDSVPRASCSARCDDGSVCELRSSHPPPSAA